MRRDFVADVSHELRTPLTSIYGFAQAMLDGVVSKEDQVRRYLQVITDESLRLVRLTNALLDLSRMESHHVKLQLEPLNLSEVVSDTLASLEPQLAEKEVTAESFVGPSLPPVMADADRLEQILLNLLDNASRHVPEGGRVAVSADIPIESPGYVTVNVTDNGPGIPDDEIKFIWERFYKFDNSRKGGRSGQVWFNIPHQSGL
jgi:two-component system sensor histidine kinase ResE